METVPYKIRFALLGAFLVPCFGRLALHGTGREHEYFRYLVPLFIGSLAGFLIGYMKDKWLKSNTDLVLLNRELEEKIEAQEKAETALRESEERYRNLFENNHAVMLLIDPESAEIIDANPAAISYYGWELEELVQKKISDINMFTHDQVYQEMARAKKEQRTHFIFKHRLSNGDIRDVEVYSGPIQLRGKKLLYSIVHDITDRVCAEKGREKVIAELEAALNEIHTLKGIIPICSNCKNIRNDEGAWDQLQKNVQEKSKAEFSHGICPDCAKKLYPDFDIHDPI